MLSQPKPDKAAPSKGAHGIDRGWMEGATGGKYAEQTIQESNHPPPFRFGDVLFGAFWYLFQLLCAPLELRTDAESSLAALVYTMT